ncbi:MAG: hypothetical protein LBU41_04895 [Clostridiales Family XIII bacterium]|jgi:hypothetical protein|nr:hypothetical protein [Clostridiales Family XIII bacterium]
MEIGLKEAARAKKRGKCGGRIVSLGLAALLIAMIYGLCKDTEKPEDETDQ